MDEAAAMEKVAPPAATPTTKAATRINRRLRIVPPTLLITCGAPGDSSPGFNLDLPGSERTAVSSTSHYWLVTSAMDLALSGLMTRTHVSR